MHNNEIELLYINTNLLYKDTILLDWFLSIFQDNELFDRLKFTTSYDVEGRFNNILSEQIFYKNLKHITDTYKNIKVVVNTILTKECCKRIKQDIFGTDYLLNYISKQNKHNITIKEWIDYFKVKIRNISCIKN